VICCRRRSYDISEDLQVGGSPAIRLSMDGGFLSRDKPLPLPLPLLMLTDMSAHPSVDFLSASIAQLGERKIEYLSLVRSRFEALFRLCSGDCSSVSRLSSFDDDFLSEEFISL